MSTNFPASSFWALRSHDPPDLYHVGPDFTLEVENSRQKEKNRYNAYWLKSNKDYPERMVHIAEYFMT